MVMRYRQKNHRESAKRLLSRFVFGEHSDGAFGEFLFLNDIPGVTAVGTNATTDTLVGIDGRSLDSAHFIDFRFGESIGLKLRAIHFELHVTHFDRVVSRLFAFEVAQIAVFAVVFSQREACLGVDLGQSHVRFPLDPYVEWLNRAGGTDLSAEVAVLVTTGVFGKSDRSPHRFQTEFQPRWM